MPLQATSGAASYDAFGGGVPVVPNYIEDVFSTYLYTGNGSTQTITNGIDLSTKGGLVWIKNRGTVELHQWWTTLLGNTSYLRSNSNDALFNSGSAAITYNANGFSLNTSSSANNANANTYVGWTFRKQPKFFDVVTYTGTGSARTVTHNLGSVPGCVMVKSTSGAGAWVVYHRGVNGGTNPQNYGMTLNATAAQYALTNFWNDTAPTSTVFTVGAAGGETNETGTTYVAYLFAHNAGGFGLTGTDNVISCGSYTGTGASLNVSLGYEPQWILARASSTTSNWRIFDNMRGWPAPSGQDAGALFPNLSNEETVNGDLIYPTSTGFQLSTNGTLNTNGATYIYIAIRRGPMKVPTSGTSVFTSIYQTPQSAGTLRTVGFPADLMIGTYTAAATPRYVNTRLTGLANNSGSAQTTPKLQTQSTAAESNAYPLFYDVWNTTARDGDYIFGSNGINWMFGRAPSFFDVVCYTGNGSTQNVSHNLGAVPELMIVKSRSLSDSDWWVYASALTTPQNKYLRLQSTDGESTATGLWGSSLPTSTTFGLGAFAPNSSGATFVAYLFATCAGVSKVGSYTGTATTLQVDCGFTGGARFVLIKRTDSTGAWYVWDSARGIIAGNDPYLLLNSTAAEVTNTDYVDTYSAGFEISSTAPAAINASGGTFVFLAIA